MRAWILIPLLLCSGCSTVPFQDATGSLDKGLAAAEGSLSALDNRDKVAAAILKYEPSTDIAMEPCKPGARDKTRNCALSINGKVIGPSSRISRGLLLAKALAQYGKGLDDLAGAKDVDKLNSTIGDINFSALGAAKAAGAALPKYVEPAGDLAVFILGQVSEFQRTQIIRTILLSYRATFNSAIEVLKEEALRLQTRTVSNETTFVNLQIDRLRRSTDSAERLQLLADIVPRQTQLQALANQDVGRLFTSLASAHEKLVDVARDPQISLSDAQKAISDFYKKAKALHDALHPGSASKS